MVRARDAKGRFVKKGKGTNGDKSQTIYMPIQQASDGKSAEAIVVKKENADKVDVTNVKIAEKWFNHSKLKLKYWILYVNY